MKNDYIKDTRIRHTHSGIKRKATCYVYITGSPHHDAEGLSQIRSCLHDAIINATPRIGGKIDKFELYRQCSPRRVKDTEIKELEKCECVSSIMTIVTVLKIDRSKMDTLGTILRIDDDVYVCNCTVYSHF